MDRHTCTLMTCLALLLAPGCDTLEVADVPAPGNTLSTPMKGDDDRSIEGLSAERYDEVVEDSEEDGVSARVEGDASVAGAEESPLDEALWPVPILSEDLSEACPAATESPWYFQYVDNLCGEKVWPTDTDRERMCPTRDTSPVDTLPDGTVVTYAPSFEPIVWETDRLAELLPPGMRMVVILIKRIEGVPHYRYLSNGDHDFAAQPWSTTKIFAAANAAATLRIESDYLMGLDATADGYPLGDLVTSICAYDEAPFSSNSLGRWFHDIGGREQAQALIGERWLKRPADERFGGNYGDSAPPIPYVFVGPGGEKMTLLPDLSGGYINHLSLHTLAEGLKRIVLHREEPEQRLPGLQWADARTLLYGAEESELYGPWGGMTQDTAIHLQAGHDMDYIESRSQGQWRIFSKLGLGTQGQFMNMGYACWPALDDAGEPIEGLGREFIIAAHLDSGGATWDARDRLFTSAYRKTVLRIVDGRL